MSYLAVTDYKAAEDVKRLDFIVNEISSYFNNMKIKILDVGCGNGNISRALGSLGHEVTGIDLSPDSIANAQRSNTFTNVKFEVINAENLSIDEEFDAIICSEVLEHLYEPSTLCRELGRLLNSGKLLIVTVPNGQGPRELFVTRPVIWIEKKVGGGLIAKAKRMLGYANATVQSSNPDLTHIQFFTRRAISKLIGEYGFKMRHFKNANFIEKVFPFSLVAKRSIPIQRFDCKVADYLPSAMSSGFYTSWIKI